MDRNPHNVSTNESSLLLKLPDSMISFNEMSSNSHLMPVAVEKTEDISPSFGFDELPSNSSTTKSLSQLEKPITILRRPSSSPPIKPSASKEYTLFPLPSPNKPVPSLYKPPVKNINRVFTAKSRSEAKYFVGTEEPKLIPTTNWMPYETLGYESTSTSIFSPVPGEIQTDSRSLDSRVPAEIPRSSSETNYFPNLKNDYEENLHSSVQNQNYSCADYLPVKPHWLFKDIIEEKEVWFGFSEMDSERIEDAFQKGVDCAVPTVGGRYDVHLNARVKSSVYFDAEDLQVRRGTWFFCNNSSQYKPYMEETAQVLEQHYFNCINSGQWQRRFNIPGVGSFVFEHEQVMLHYKDEVEVWPALSLPDSGAEPYVIKRGLPDGFKILPNESTNIDHLVFIVQGIGSFCDLRLRTVSECVDGFRDIANKLIESHLRNEVGQEHIGRVEFLPVAWHAKFHTSNIGFDQLVQSITLASIPKLRYFTNDTLSDILLYSSPSYCQSIIDTVAWELNKLHQLFLSRNPSFVGKIFVAGHSLGSLILFDILSNQDTFEKEVASQKEECLENEKNLSEVSNDCCESVAYVCNYHKPLRTVDSLLEVLNLTDYADLFHKEKIDLEALGLLKERELKDLNIPAGPLKKLCNAIIVKQKKPIFKKNSTVSKIQQNQETTLSSDTSEHMMIYPSQALETGMSLIEYPSLLFEPAGFFALGSPIAFFLAVRGYDAINENFRLPTCPAFFHIFHPYDPVAFLVEPMIKPNFSEKPVLIPHHKGRKRLHIHIRENFVKFASDIKHKVLQTLSLQGIAKNQYTPNSDEINKMIEPPVEGTKIGLLNGGRRIDYVLQEKPIEAINEYLFALSSHATYWNSEDTVLMMLREIYATQGIFIYPEQMPSERNTLADSLMGFSGNDSNIQTNLSSVETSNIPTESMPVIHTGPPPLSGFVKQSPFSK